MLASSIPSKIQLPFASSGTKNTIPVPSQIGITPGAASYTDGFPPLTFTALTAGGIPPDGADVNGVLNAITAIQQWQSAGGHFKYDSAFSTAIGGYPAGAILNSSDGLSQWLNLADNNTTDPDGATPANWAALSAYGITTVSGLTNANVTLTATQYKNRIIVLTGTLTGNIQIIFPTLLLKWEVINNTIGNFSITCKTAAGSGVIVGGIQEIYSDGTNIVAGMGDARYGSAMLPFNVTQASNLLTGGLAPCKVDFRNLNLATGTPVQYSLTNSLSLAMNNIAASLGATTAVATRLAWAIVYGAGAPQIAVANMSGGLQIDESNLITTSAIGAGSTSSTTWYSASAIATPSQYKIIGICDAVWTSGVGWASPTLVQPAGFQSSAVLINTTLTASLGADVSITSIASYFDGPSVAQGTTGRWFVSGSISLYVPTANDAIKVKLWDGNTVIDSRFVQFNVAGYTAAISLSGYIPNPTGNLRISVQNISSTNSVIKFNSTGNSKDSTITAMRVG